MPGFLEQIVAKQTKLQQEVLSKQPEEKVMARAEEEKMLATKVNMSLHDRLDKLALAYGTTKKRVTKVALERGLAQLEKENFLGTNNELGTTESKETAAKQLREHLIELFGDKSIVVSATANQFVVECSETTLIAPNAVPQTWDSLPVRVKRRKIPTVRGPEV